MPGNTTAAATRDGQIEGLRYVMEWIRCLRETTPKTPAYLAAMNDIEVICGASLERLERGEAMESISVAAAK